MLQTITDERSAQLCKAERSLLFHLEGGCQVRLLFKLMLIVLISDPGLIAFTAQIAMGVSATLDEDTLTLNSTVLSRDGKESVHGASATDPDTRMRYMTNVSGEMNDCRSDLWPSNGRRGAG